MIWDRKFIHFFGLAYEALPEEKKRLGWLCVVALFGHIAAFFVLHVSYPPQQYQRTQRTQITLYTPETMVQSGLNNRTFWLEMNDPSRFIRPQSDWVVTQLAPSEINPRWQKVPGESRVLLPLAGDLQFLPDRLAPLSERAFESLRPPSQSFQFLAHDLPASARRTVVEWEEPLRSRLTVEPWVLPPAKAELLDQARVTVLRVGLDRGGEVNHVLIEASSGKSEIDLLAVDSLRSRKFKPVTEGGIVWGRVTIFWLYQGTEPE